MDVGAAFVAGAEPFEGTEPREAAFDDPASLAEAGAVWVTTAGDDRGDPSGADELEDLLWGWMHDGEPIPVSGPNHR